ncbi:DUF4347 domain-containing protein [Terasakiella sp. SH-1]|uniref:DUF4347 domain-containing protein n=1 Tax=Terasakiella sp. SH-1 TaxID=2560057 RepID=UPI00142F5E11|nr:DUF4347 domain-containing protein [Terasakiella sp. SH-1]
MNFVKRWSKSLSPQKDNAVERRPLAHALEPRIMFDAAVVSTTSELADLATESENSGKEVAVVDTSIADYEKLVTALDGSIDVILINGQDGLNQLSEALEGYGDIDVLHIISHGSAGMLSLGGDIISSDTLEQHSESLTSIGGSLSEDGDILLYGCEVASAGGVQFITDLSQITGADIAASDDLTGNADSGGDWDLEIVSGDVDGKVAFSEQALKDFSHVLAYSGTVDFSGNNADPGEYSTDGSKDAKFNVGAYTLIVDGADAGTEWYAASSYVTFGYKNSDDTVIEQESKVTLSFSGGESFDVTSLKIYNLIGAGDTFTISSDKGDSFTTGVINKDAEVTPTLNFTGITKLYVTAADNTLFGHLDDFTIANVQAASSDAEITSSTYDASTGVMVVTGANFTANGSGADVDASDLTITGEGGDTYTLTDTADVEITSATQFSLTLSATDKAAVNQILNKDGTSSTGSTTYDLDSAAGFMTDQSSISDTGTNGITVSSVAAPTITSATYNAATGTVVITGTNFVKSGGVTNDVDASDITFTGEDGATYTLTDTSDVEITSGTSATLTLSATDKAALNLIMNKDGTSSTGATPYNIAGAAGFMAGDSTAAADSAGGVTVSSVPAPTVTSAAYDYSTNILTVTGTGFVRNSGGANDVDVSDLTLTGEGGASYTLTSATDVEITNATTFSVTLSGADIVGVESLLNKDGLSADSGTTYNLAAAAGFMAGDSTSAGDASAGITVSNYAAPTITSVAYNYTTNQLVVTGTNFVSKSGGANDVDVSLLTITGEGGPGNSHTLTSTSSVEIDSATQFTITLSGTDLVNVDTLLNKDGTTSSTGGTTFNLAAADNWMTASPAGTDISDATSAITVSSFANPAITSAAYDWNTGALVLTGTNFVSKSGGSNDIDASLLTLTGEGGSTYTLTDTSDVDVTSATSATLTLSATDRLAVNGLLNKDGLTSATAGTTFNLAAADDWMTGSPAGNTITDGSTGVTVSNYAAPTITSAAYDYNTNILTVTGTNFVSKSGGANDIDISMLTFTGEGGATYTLSSATDVDVTSATEFSVTLTGMDVVGVESLLNKDGASADGSTSYNLAAAEDWLAQAPTGTNIADTTGNAITVSNYAVPAITSASYDWSTGQLVLTGTNFVSASGASNDIDASLLTLTGEGGATYTLTDTSDVEVTSATSATLTLSATDQLNVHGLFNKDGASAEDSTTYNLSAAEDWATGAPSSENIVDTATGVSVSNVVAPTITSATYDSDTGVLQVTGTNFVKYSGANNDVNIGAFTLTGEGGSHTITSTSDVEITSATSFSVTLSGSDKTNVNSYLDQLGTSSSGGTLYNIAAADNWMAGSATSTNISDTTSNGVTVSIAPKITSAAYNASTGALVVTGTNIQAAAGANNDIDASVFTFTGENGETYTLIDTADVERTSATQFTLTLSATDKAAVNLIMNKDGSSSTGATSYNIAVADDWNTNVTDGDTSDTTGNAITVSSVPAPTIASATYNANTGAVVLTGTNFVKSAGAANDVDASKLTFTGEGGETYTLTNTTDVEITSGTSATLTLSATDKAALNLIMNTDGASSTGATTFNIAAAAGFMTGDGTTAADTTGNAVNVSNVQAPTITSATYNTSTGAVVLTGTNFVKNSGAANDVDASSLTFTGEGGTYTLTDTSDVEITSGTTATLTLSATDKTALNLIMDKAGASSSGGTPYNIAGAAGFMAGDSTTAADTTGNAVTVTVTISEATGASSSTVTPPPQSSTSESTPVNEASSSPGFFDEGLGGDKPMLGDTGGLSIGSDINGAGVSSVTVGEVMSDGGGLNDASTLIDPSAGVNAMSIVRNAVTGNDGTLNKFYGAGSHVGQVVSESAGGATSDIGAGNIASLVGDSVVDSMSGLGNSLGGGLGGSFNNGLFGVEELTSAQLNTPDTTDPQEFEKFMADLASLNDSDMKAKEFNAQLGFNQQLAQETVDKKTMNLQDALSSLG